MKPVAFDYRRPRSVDEALDMLGTADNAKILAGGQTLGPMLNLRLVRPSVLVDITRIADLVSARDDGDRIRIGASVTHAAIEDGAVPDIDGGFLARVARTIAYRAVRTRGTIGGSLAHADPAADWLTALVALDAELILRGAAGQRRVALREFVTGVFDTALGGYELLEAVDIPKGPRGARYGFYKFCRKAGEFAEAMAAAAIGGIGGGFRVVAGATNGAPVVIEDPALLGLEGPLELARVDSERAVATLRERGVKGDPYDLRLHAVALERALWDALAP